MSRKSTSCVKKGWKFVKKVQESKTYLKALESAYHLTQPQTNQSSFVIKKIIKLSCVYLNQTRTSNLLI